MLTKGICSIFCSEGMYASDTIRHVAGHFLHGRKSEWKFFASSMQIRKFRCCTVVASERVPGMLRSRRRCVHGRLSVEARLSSVEAVSASVRVSRWLEGFK